MGCHSRLLGGGRERTRAARQSSTRRSASWRARRTRPSSSTSGTMTASRSGPHGHNWLGLLPLGSICRRLVWRAAFLMRLLSHGAVYQCLLGLPASCCLVYRPAVSWLICCLFVRCAVYYFEVVLSTGPELESIFSLPFSHRTSNPQIYCLLEQGRAPNPTDNGGLV